MADITITDVAAFLFGVPADQVTKEQTKAASQVMHGILLGSPGSPADVLKASLELALEGALPKYQILVPGNWSDELFWKAVGKAEASRSPKDRADRLKSFLMNALRILDQKDVDQRIRAYYRKSQYFKKLRNKQRLDKGDSLV